MLTYHEVGMHAGPPTARLTVHDRIGSQRTMPLSGRLQRDRLLPGKYSLHVRARSVRLSLMRKALGSHLVAEG